MRPLEKELQKHTEMMEPVRRNVARERPSVGVLDTSYHNAPTSPPRAAAQSKSACDFKDDLLLAIAPLMVILLMFSGRWGVLAACAGGTICYIFDIVGSVEGTIGTLIMTVLCEVACTVFAARTFLSESIWNFSVIVLVWITLFFAFLISCNYFVGIVKEFGIVLVVMNQLIFATLPMVAASIISWFLCIEVPSLDLLLCFNTTYFIYMLFLGRPRLVSPERKKSGKVSPTTPTAAAMRVILPPHLLLLMYAVPIVMTIFMHIAVHHNVLSTAHTRVTNFVLSVLTPCLLMTYCAYKQLVQSNLDFHEADTGLFTALPKFLDYSTIGLTVALVYCLESHPLMDEIKSFSEMPKDMAGYAIMAMVGLIVAAFAVHRFCRQQSQLLAEQSDAMGNLAAVAVTKAKLQAISIVASLCIGGANALFAAIIGLPDHAVGVSIVGAMSLAEFYLHSDWSWTSRLLLVFISALYSGLATSSFIKMTLQGITYVFRWYVDVSMADFTTLVNVLVPVAIVLPTLVGPASAAVKESVGLLPGAPAGSEETGGGVGRVVFEWLFPLVCAVVCGAEFMIREQDWGDVNVSVEVVYPLYYFLGMSALVLGTGLALYSAHVIGPVTMWVLCVMQGCKLLHLLGIRAMGALTACLMILAYTLPFIRTVTKYLQAGQEDQGHVGHVTPRSAAKTAISTLELLLYLCLATLATYWAREHQIAHHVLQSVLARDPTDLQQTTLCLAVWLAYLGCVLLVFYRTAKLLRTVVLVLGGLCLLVALEGFGHLNMTIERSSAAYLTVAFHPDMNVQEHPAVFLFLSTALSGLAWIGLIPLHSIFTCLLYSALFGFISAKAMLGWAFPLSLADDSFTHHIAAFPFLYLFAAKFLLTFVAVWNPALSRSQAKTSPGNLGELFAEAPLVLACAAPFFGLLWALSVNLYTQAMPGIAWSAAVGFATLCGTTRAREIYSETVGARSSRASSVTPSGPVPFSACVPCAALTVFWVAFAVLSAHGYDRDLLIPAAGLTILCTPPGAILRGKSPLVAAGALCAAFWSCSALYAILVKGYGSDPLIVSFEKPQDYFQLDSDMSVWTNASLKWPLLNLVQLLAPLPALAAGLMPQFGKSEDVLFVFALVSLVPVFAAHLSALRYLGIVGMLFAASKGYRVNDQQQRSDRLI